MDGDRTFDESAFRIGLGFLQGPFAETGGKFILGNSLHFEDNAVLLFQNGNDLAGFLLPFAADDFNGVAFFDVIALRAFFGKHHSTSGAKEMIFMKFFSRSSRATGPKIRVPRGFFSSSIRTAELRSKRR